MQKLLPIEVRTKLAFIVFCVFLQLFSATVLAVPVQLTFQYPAHQADSQVFLVGSFNNWSSNDPDFQFTDEDGDLIYTLQIVLDTSIREIAYKIVDNGEWNADPFNPRVSSDQFKNSLLTINDPMFVNMLPLDGSLRNWNSVIRASIGSSLQSSVKNEDLTLRINGQVVMHPSSAFEAASGLFSWDAKEHLRYGTNEVSITVSTSAGQVINQVQFDFRPPWEKSLSPVLSINERLDGQQWILEAVGSSPGGESLTYQWAEDQNLNPAALTLSSTQGSSTSVTLPDKHGEYFINCEVTDASGRSARARRMVTVSENGINLHDLNDHASWINDMVLYEIFPFGWHDESNADRFTYIESELDRLSSLGVNTIWLTPITKGRGVGYWTQDYFQVNPQLGETQNFRKLVEEVHKKGMKIILDFVPNHTDVWHPFYENVQALKENSPFADYYLWKGAPGNSEHQHYFDWVNLPNLNFSNPDLQEYMIDAALFWLTEFNVDGLRVDVAWGPHERTPTFWRKFNERIRNIRPEVFLLGESDVRLELFEERFTTLYDWDLRGFDQVTGLPAALNGTLSLDQLHSILSFSYPSGKYPLRFIENHDVGRAADLFGIERSLLAHTLVLTVPGVPLIYGGAESGQTEQFTGPAMSNPNLESQFAQLVDVRNRYIKNDASLHRLNNDQSSSVYSYATVTGTTAVVTSLNFSNLSKSVQISLDGLPSPLSSPYKVTSLSGGQDINLSGNSDSVGLTLGPYESHLYLVELDMQSSTPEEPSAPPFEPLTNWSLFSLTSAATATANQVGDDIRVEIDRAGTADWNIQIIFNDIGLEQGQTYQLQYEASADSDRDINVAFTRDGGNFEAYAFEKVSLGNNRKLLQSQFKMNASSDPKARLIFEMGLSDIDVSISNVGFRNITELAENPEQYQFTYSNTNGGRIESSLNAGNWPEGTQATLTAIANDGYRFEGWTGGITSSENPVTIQLSKDLNIRANFSLIPIPEYTLAFSNTPGGRIESSKAQGNWPEGTQATLTAIANDGYRFEGWTGGLTSSDNPVTIQLSKDFNIRANFSLIPKFTLTFSDSTGGQIESNRNSGTWPSGTQVTITAVPEEGYTFNGWTGGITSPQNPFSFHLTQNLSIEADFIMTQPEAESLTEWTLFHLDNATAASASDLDGEIQVKIDRAGTAPWNIQIIFANLNLEQGEVYELQYEASADSTRTIETAFTQDGGNFQDYARRQASLNTQRKVFQWQFEMSSQTDSKARLVFSMGHSDTDVTIANVRLRRVLEIPSYTFSLINSDGGITQSNVAAGAWPSGTSVTVTAVPENGYEFTGWSGDLISLENPLTFPLVRDIRIVANYQPVRSNIEPPSITYSRESDHLRINWDPGIGAVLEAAASVSGPYSPVTGNLKDGEAIIDIAKGPSLAPSPNAAEKDGALQCFFRLIVR